MATTEHETRGDAHPLIASIQDAEQSAVDAVRKFLDAVDSAVPDVSDDGLRRKIIDSAFDMTEQLIAASNRLAQKVVDITEHALEELDKNAGATKK